MIWILIASVFWGLHICFSIFNKRNNNVFYGLFIAGGGIGLLSAAGITFLKGEAQYNIPFPFSIGNIEFSFHIDLLAAWFLVLIGIISIAIAAYTGPYINHIKKSINLPLFWTSLSILLLSMMLVVLSSNALTFLVFWELMSLSSFFLVATDSTSIPTRQAAITYLGATRAGTALLSGGVIWSYALTGNWSFNDWHLAGPQALGPGILILLGLGVKAGMWPFHLWLPSAHPAAPSPVSALMSGVMVKVAIYMMIRLFLIPGAFSHPLFGYVFMVIGAISAFWGVLFALLQHDLKRLLAYHTVENIGLILLGIGISLIAHDFSLGSVARTALAAALFHTMNHGIFKSLLFLSSGAVDMQTGTRDLERLGGLGKKMPVTFAMFLVGSAAICALPPLNGFASEWLLYQSILNIANHSISGLITFVALILIGWIALIGTLALACFTKAIGTAFLGHPRSSLTEHTSEAPAGLLVSQGFLAILCFALGLLAPHVLRFLHPIVSSLEPTGLPLDSYWNISLFPFLFVFCFVITSVAIWKRRASIKNPVEFSHTWECGFGELTSRMQTTATSFAQPIVRIFGALYQYAVLLRIDGIDRKHFPEEIRAELKTKAILESNIYSPFIRKIEQIGEWVLRIQMGSIHIYLLTMLLTLIALLFWGRYLP